MLRIRKITQKLENKTENLAGMRLDVSHRAGNLSMRIKTITSNVLNRCTTFKIASNLTQEHGKQFDIM